MLSREFRTFSDTTSCSQLYSQYHPGRILQPVLRTSDRNEQRILMPMNCHQNSRLAAMFAVPSGCSSCLKQKSVLTLCTAQGSNSSLEENESISGQFHEIYANNPALTAAPSTSPRISEGDTKESTSGSTESSEPSPSLASCSPAGTILDLHSLRHLSQVLEASASTSRLVVVQCGFTWCRPCLGFKRKYERFSEVFSNVQFVKLQGNETDDTKKVFKKLSQSLAELAQDAADKPPSDTLPPASKGISGTPAHVVFRNGELQGSVDGANAVKLRDAILAHLRSDELPTEDAIAQLTRTDKLGHSTSMGY